MQQIKITIADGHFLSRKGLVELLKINNNFILIAEALSAEELIAQAKHLKPNLIIIDYTSTNFGLDNLKQITSKYPNSRLLAITELNTNKTISKALSAGVTSHLLKDCDEEEIVEAIYKTSNGEKFMCSKIVTSILDTDKELNTGNICEGLNISEREMEIITLVAEGLSNKQVADKLFLSTHTVITHRKNIMNKIGAKNTAGLVMFAVRENLVSPNQLALS